MNNIEKVEKLMESVFLNGSDFEALAGNFFSINESKLNNSELRNKLSGGQSLFADTTKIVEAS